MASPVGGAWRLKSQLVESSRIIRKVLIDNLQHLSAVEFTLGIAGQTFYGNPIFRALEFAQFIRKYGLQSGTRNI